MKIEKKKKSPSQGKDRGNPPKKPSLDQLMDNLIYSHLSGFFSIVQCIWSRTHTDIAPNDGTQRMSPGTRSVMHLLHRVLAWGCTIFIWNWIGFEAPAALNRFMGVGIVWIAPAVHLMVPLHLPKQGRHQCSAQSGATHIHLFLSRYKMWPQCCLFLPFKCSHVVAFCIGGL